MTRTPVDDGRRPSDQERMLAASIWRMPREQHPMAGLLAPAETLLAGQVARRMQLEEAPLADLITVRNRSGTPSFPQPTGILQGKWGYMLSRDFLERDDARALRAFLRKNLEGGSVVELGVGENANSHEKVFRQIFGVTDYRAVDSRSVSGNGVRRADMLEFLAELPSKSTHVAAFGVFNEPLSVVLSGIPQDIVGPMVVDLEHSYCRRLCRELNRVVPPAGLLFGDGLRPMNYFSTMARYITGHGFTLLEEPLQQIPLVIPDDCQPIRDPFFFRRG